MASSKGIVVVNSAGNEGGNAAWGGWISVPSDASNILSVGAVGAEGQYVSFSGKGPTPDGRIKPDLVARGSGAVTANVFENTGITTNSGTSFSAPIMAGLVAGFWQAHPNLPANQVMSLLKNSGSNRDNPNNQIGWGIPGFIKAHILAGGNPVLSFPFEIRLFPNPSEGAEITLNILQSTSIGQIDFEVLDSRGKVLTEGRQYINNKSEIRIPAGKMKPGIYVLKINTNAGQTSRKFVVN
jgi:hypothetical protein